MNPQILLPNQLQTAALSPHNRPVHFAKSEGVFGFLRKAESKAVAKPMVAPMTKALAAKAEAYNIRTPTFEAGLIPEHAHDPTQLPEVASSAQSFRRFGSNYSTRAPSGNHRGPGPQVQTNGNSQRIESMQHSFQQEGTRHIPQTQ